MATHLVILTLALFWMSGAAVIIVGDIFTKALKQVIAAIFKRIPKNPKL